MTDQDGPAKVSDFPLFAALTTTTYHDVWSPPAHVATSYNDIATGTVHDPIFLDTVTLPNATASANVVTQPLASGATALVTDVERLTDGSDATSIVSAVMLLVLYIEV